MWHDTSGRGGVGCGPWWHHGATMGHTSPPSSQKSFVRLCVGPASFRVPGFARIRRRSSSAPVRPPGCSTPSPVGRALSARVCEDVKKTPGTPGNRVCQKDPWRQSLDQDYVSASFPGDVRASQANAAGVTLLKGLRLGSFGMTTTDERHRDAHPHQRCRGSVGERRR